ncbi:MAG: hypothetical protein ACTHMT_09045, partial [Verrucomicrobiota bacterium]
SSPGLGISMDANHGETVFPESEFMQSLLNLDEPRFGSVYVEGVECSIHPAKMNDFDLALMLEGHWCRL